jgi:hypothetical protein
MAKLTEKQKQFLLKHNLWNQARDQSTLGFFETGAFKDFFRRKEKIELDLARLPEAKKRDLAKRLQAAENKAKDKHFKEAYRDLQAVKIEARREANGYSASLTLDDLRQQIVTWGEDGDKLQVLVGRLETGMRTVRDELRKSGRASAFATLSEATQFLQGFKQTETLLRSELTGQKKISADIVSALGRKDPGKTLADIGVQLSLLSQEHGLDVSALRSRAELTHVKFIRAGQTMEASAFKASFERYLAEIDLAVRERKDISKFQQREGGGEKIGDDTLMRNPTAWEDNPSELDDLLATIAKGHPKREYQNILLELKDVESALADEKSRNSKDFQEALQARREKALRMLALLDQRDRKRFENVEKSVLSENLGDVVSLAKTRDAPRRNQPLARFNADSVVSELTLPGDLKRASARDIQRVRQELKGAMEGLLTEELKKADSDLVFDLGLKTKENFIAELAHVLGLDPSSSKFSEAERNLLDEMATQMVESVRAKYPNKAGLAKSTLPTKDGKTTDVPTEFTMNGKKYVNPKYLASGGVGDVLRYQEDGVDPPAYTVVKTLKDQTKRDDMVTELRLHRQANGGESGDNSPYVVEMQGAIQGPGGEIYMAMEFADGGDLNDMSYTLAQAAQSGNISEETRQVLVQHMLRQAVTGMKQVQDNNMTHHDIKGMNYLVGRDGKVKVADFGSGQLGDEQGEVASSASNMITTLPYRAPELGGDKRVTGKADTYSLGVMLNKISDPMQGHGSKTGDGVEAPVTALDKLRVAMTDQDPAKRPTLESVLQTAYMTDAEASYDETQVEQMMTALLAYNQHVAGKAKKELRMVVFYQGELNILRKQRGNATFDKQTEIDGKIEAKLKDIKQQQDAIDLLLAQDDSKPYVEALRKANAALLGRGSVAPERDLAQVRFKDDYERIVAESGIPVNARLLQAVTLVDQAPDAVQRKQRAQDAAGDAERLLGQLAVVVRTASVEKAKLMASQLATEVRKLKQMLTRVAEA